MLTSQVFAARLLPERSLLSTRAAGSDRARFIDAHRLAALLYLLTLARENRCVIGLRDLDRLGLRVDELLANWITWIVPSLHRFRNARWHFREHDECLVRRFESLIRDCYYG